MEIIKLIKIDNIESLVDTDNKFIIKNIIDGRLYFGDNEDPLNEIKTDKSNNWAKTFFYGGN